MRNYKNEYRTTENKNKSHKHYVEPKRYCRIRYTKLERRQNEFHGIKTQDTNTTLLPDQ